MNPQVLLHVAVLGQQSSRSSSRSGEPADVVAGLVGLAVFVAVYLVYGFVMSRIHKKAGNPAWWGFVPIVNEYGIIKLTGREWWWLLLYFIPCVSFVVAIVIAIDLTKSFGKSAAWALGLLLLPFIFYPMLAFGSARYVGPANATGAGGYGGGANPRW
jgi:hypothetical protein